MFDNDSVSRIFVNQIKLVIIFILFGTNSSYAEVSQDFTETYKEQREAQGEIHYSKANEFYSDKQYKACIDKINEFLFLFPGHPATVRSLKLLSQAYRKNDQINDSIRTDLTIYRENPTTEIGLSSYLDAGKKMLLVGKLKDGKKVLEIVKNQLYSSKIAKDAEIELKQNSILEENGFQNNEEIDKEEKY